jgi:hypothetical protein
VTLDQEAQLQARLSWAIPRYIEARNQDAVEPSGTDPENPKPLKTWFSLCPSSGSQATDDLSATGFDMLALFGATSVLVFELKATQFNKTVSDSVHFQEGQLAFLKKLGAKLPVFVCCVENRELLSKPIEPCEHEAIRSLSAILALRPETEKESPTHRIDVPKKRHKDSAYPGACRDGLLISVINKNIYGWSEDGGDSQTTEAWIDGDSWEPIVKDMIEHYGKTALLPPNLYFLAISDISVGFISAPKIESVVRLIRSCHAKAVAELRDVARASRGKAYSNFHELRSLCEEQAEELVAAAISQDDPALAVDRLSVLTSIEGRRNAILEAFQTASKAIEQNAAKVELQALQAVVSQEIDISTAQNIGRGGNGPSKDSPF